MFKRTINHHLVHSDATRVQNKLEHFAGEYDKAGKSSLMHQAPVKEEVPKAPEFPSFVAGLVHGMVVLMSFTSFAFMIFGNSEHPELQAAFPLAISQQVLSASVLIGILTFRGHFPFALGGPTPPAALLVADVVRAAVDAVEESDKKVPTAFLVIALVSIIMGVLLVFLGRSGHATFAQQLPYPIMCGFLGSVGALLSRNAVQILLGVKLRWVFVPKRFDDFAEIDVPIALAHVCLGLAVCVLFLFGVPRISALVKKRGFKGTAVLPLAFVFPLLCFFITVGASGMDFGAAGELRTTYPSWLFPKLETEAFWTFWGEAYAASRWDLNAVASSVPHMLIASILCVLAALINMAGIEANAPLPKVMNLNGEFKWLGWASLVTGALGGHPGHHVAAFTLPMKKDGGSTRLAPWTSSLLWFVVFITSAPINSFVPRFFMGGCFLQIGVGLARTFLWDNRKTMDCASKVIVWVMVLLSLFFNLNYSAGFGFVLVCLNFIRISEGVNVVHNVTRLDMQRSPRQRPMEEIQLLTKYGHKVMMIHLNGYLFWGTTDKIFHAFDEIIDGGFYDPDVIYVDLEHVCGVEVSVVGAFKKLHRIAKNSGINIILCGFPDIAVLGPQIDTLLRSLPFANSKPYVELLEESEDQLINAVLHEMPHAWHEPPLTSLQLELRERRTLCKQSILARYSHASGSVYALRWEVVDNYLHLGQVHYSDERALFLVKAALANQTNCESFATHSARMQPRCVATPNAKDLLRQSYQRQQALICRDVLHASLEAFPRQESAKQFRIQRMVFVPTADGVYEFGALRARTSQIDLDLRNIEDLDIPALADLNVRLFAQTVAPLYTPPALEENSVYTSKTGVEDPDTGHLISPEQLDSMFAYMSGLQQYISHNLLLSMLTLCTYKQVKKNEPLIPDERSRGIADCMFIIEEGVFGTFNNHLDAVWDEDAYHPGNLVLKAGVGSLLGANDMFLERPWSVKIVCVSEVGKVLCLHKDVVKQLEQCESPFVTLESAHEFVQYLKRQMALQEMTMSSSINASRLGGEIGSMLD